MAPKLQNGKEHSEASKLTRIAIVNADRCKPKKCRQECKKSCPVVRVCFRSAGRAVDALCLILRNLFCVADGQALVSLFALSCPYSLAYSELHRQY